MKALSMEVVLELSGQPGWVMQVPRMLAGLEAERRRCIFPWRGG